MTTRRQQMQCACLDVAVPIIRPTIITIYRSSSLAELCALGVRLSFIIALLVQTATADAVTVNFFLFGACAVIVFSFSVSTLHGCPGFVPETDDTCVPQ